MDCRRLLCGGRGVEQEMTRQHTDMLHPRMLKRALLPMLSMSSAM